MLKVNEHFLELPANYLFSEMARRVALFKESHPNADVISLSIGDVTCPLAPARRLSQLIFLPLTEGNGFCPELPCPRDPVPDLIYLCFPNNPAGSAVTTGDLKDWVGYALCHGSVILYDAAYEAYITEDLPHSIFKIDGARGCAIEFGSFSQLAGFTSVRLAYTVIPAELEAGGVRVKLLWVRRQATKFNGASYLSQRASKAVYSAEGYAQVMQTVRYYYGKCGRHPKGPLRPRPYGLRWDQRPLHLDEDAAGDGFLVFLRPPFGRSVRGRHAGRRLWAVRRRLFPADGFRRQRTDGASHGPPRRFLLLKGSGSGLTSEKTPFPADGQNVPESGVFLFRRRIFR